MRGSEHAGGGGSRAAVDDERNDATTEMTIIRADKIAFDERQPAALHPLKPARRHHPPAHSLTPLHSLRRENRSDRKRSRTGNSTRVIRDGRKDAAVEQPGRPDDRSGRAGRVAPR